MHVKFGKEILYLEGWCARTQYNACCRLLGPGINIHLAENLLLREIFHLGNKVLPVPSSQKTSKLERVGKTYDGLFDESLFLPSHIKAILIERFCFSDASLQTLMNAAAFKARTIQRNKSRDKRSAAMAP